MNFRGYVGGLEQFYVLWQGQEKANKEVMCAIEMPGFSDSLRNLRAVLT